MGIWHSKFTGGVPQVQASSSYIFAEKNNKATIATQISVFSWVAEHNFIEHLFQNSECAPDLKKNPLIQFPEKEM